MFKTLSQYSREFGIAASFTLVSIPAVLMLGYDVNGAFSRVQTSQAIQTLSGHGWTVISNEKEDRHSLVQTVEGCRVHFELRSWRAPLSGTWHTTIADHWSDCDQ